MEQELQIMHPRPSSIVAALYTLRDLEADVVILHGPPGCSFKHARLMEEDGVKVVTTAMDESQFIFGGETQLAELIKIVIKRFNPKILGVVGTCASMIIGEDMQNTVTQIETDTPIIVVDIHAGYHDNTIGVIKTLEAANAINIITDKELKRQKYILEEATLVEKRHGAASKDYLTPSRGDTKYSVAQRVIELIKSGRKGLNILNAKKETAYMFADINLAIDELAGKGQIVNFANLDPTRGLPRVRRCASDISAELKTHNMAIDHCTGGLDEYGIAGNVACDIIRENYSDYDFAIITGVPHALPMDSLSGMELVSITNGPRQVQPLKDMGHEHVLVEIDLHPKTLGVRSIVESEFGATLRELTKNKK